MIWRKLFKWSIEERENERICEDFEGKQSEIEIKSESLRKTVMGDSDR